MEPKIPIDLATGFPANSLLPVDRLKEASASALSNPTVWEDGMVYGADDGYLPLRENIATWLTGYYAPPGDISADRICITGGASQNLACILQVFTDPIKTRKVWVVEPSYFLGFRIFEDAGFQGRLHGVPEDEEGLDVAFLEKALREESEAFEASGLAAREPIKKPFPYRKLYSHVIYCVPTFSNPSGVVMSRPRREALIRLARKYDALIVSDDVYDFVHFSTGTAGSSPGSFSSLKPIQPRLVDLERTLDGGLQDEFGNTVSNGSFSKIVGPGCRVGWAEGTSKFIYGLSQAGSSRSGGAPSHLMSTFINELLVNDFIPTHIASTLIPAYQHRYITLKSAIETHLLPLGVSFNSAALSSPKAGGFFFWLKLPAPLSAQKVLDVALEQKKLTLSSGPFSALPEGNTPVSRYEDRIRLCFTRVDEGELVEGVVRLSGVIRRLLSLA